MQDVIIVGAGSYGREIYWTLVDHNSAAESLRQEQPYHILGFINDIPETLSDYKINAQILGTIQDWQPRGDEVYALGIGSPEAKKKLSELLKPRGIRFMSHYREQKHMQEKTAFRIMGCATSRKLWDVCEA